MALATARNRDGVGVSAAHDASAVGRRWTRVALIALELLLAVGAAGGAFAMYTAGDAAFGGTVTSQDLPFESWTIAAMTLLLLNAVLPAVVATAAWTGAPWARSFGHLLVSAVLAGWIAIEVVALGWISWLQPALLAYAAVIAVLGVWQRSGRVRA